MWGGWGGDPVWGGAGQEGRGDELRESGITGLLGWMAYIKPVLAAWGKDNNETNKIRMPALSTHLPIVMGKKGTFLVLRCSSAVMAASRDRHMLCPSSESSTYSRLSGLRPLSPTSPFTVYDFPLFSTTLTSSDVLWVFAPIKHECLWGNLFYSFPSVESHVSTCI